jgi:hypothetical protein
LPTSCWLALHAASGGVVGRSTRSLEGAKLAPGQLTKGQAYYRITYADPQFTIPGVEPMMYVGVDLFPEEKAAEPRYYFQDTVSFHRRGSCVEYSGPRFSDEDTPFRVFSFTAEELGTGLVELSEAVRLLSEANQRANQRK